MEALRAKSIKLTELSPVLVSSRTASRNCLHDYHAASSLDERGCQLSILAHEHPKELFAKLEAAGVKCDFREPNVIRVAPTPLYNTFHEVWRFANILRRSD